MKTRALLGLLVLCAAALALRVGGLDFLLPHRMEPDGEIVAQVRLIDEPERNQDWQYGTYGLLIAYAARALPAPEAPRADMSLDEHLAVSSYEVVRVRWVVALLSLLLIPATYLLARMALAPPAALFAAALAATCLLHLSMAQQARPHAAATGVYLIAVLAAVRLQRTPSWGSYALAGLTAGLAIGILHSGVAVLIPLALAHLLRERSQLPSSFARVALPVALIALLFALFYPFVFSETISSFHLDSEGGEIQQAGHEIDLSLFNGGGFAKVLWTLWSYDPVLLALALAGAVVAVGRARGLRQLAGRRDLLVVLAFALPYLLAIGSFEGTQERFVLPLVPYLCALGGFSADALLRAGASSPTRHRLVTLALALLVALPLGFAWRLSAVRSADDTFEQAAAWIEDNLNPAEDELLVMFPIQLPLFHDESSAAELAREIPNVADFYPIATRWQRYELYTSGIAERAGPDTPRRWNLRLGKPVDLDPERSGGSFHEHLRSRGIDYVVVEIFPPERGVAGGALPVQSLQQVGRRVARFAPWREADSSDSSYEYEGMPSHPEAHVVRYLLSAERVGPVLEIYDVR